MMKLHESRFLQVLLAAATLWLPAFLILIVGFVVGVAMFGLMEDWKPEEAFPVFLVLFLLLLATLPVALIVSSTYVLLALKSDRVPEDRRKTWLGLILFGAPVTMPIFFYLYVWRKPGPPS